MMGQPSIGMCTSSMLANITYLNSLLKCKERIYLSYVNMYIYGG